MLSGNNGILQKATDAKTLTERASVIEQARTDVLGYQAENKGGDLDKSQLKSVLDTYFKNVPAELPDGEELSNLELATLDKYGTHQIKVSEIYYGDLKQEIKETTIAKSTEKTDSYVGYYADINNDGKVDGIIYADMLVGNTKSGRWNNDDEGWSDYNVMKIDDAASVKDYVVSSKIYKGQTTAGKYKANDGFGEKEVLVPATNSTGTKDRFYVMTLEDFANNSKNQFYWYYNAIGNLDGTIGNTVIDFGEGKQKTIDMINDWNNNTAEYGEQTTTSSGKNSIDLWGAIQDGQYSIVSSATDSGKWFVPSKAEWSAFGEELGITTGNYANKGLSGYYWSSSKSSASNAYAASFNDGYIADYAVNGINNTDDFNLFVRLSTTF